MPSHGCPKCGRTPVIFSISSQKWICKTCKHQWQDQSSSEENWEDAWGPEYVINTEAVEKLRAQLATAPKKSVAKKSVSAKGKMSKK